MGKMHNEPHVKRSSSMSFAMRWKHENLRIITGIAIFSIAAFMCLVLLYGTSTKSVSVVVNGQEQLLETKQTVLQRLLDEQAIKVGTFDHVSMPLSSPISNGDKVVIETAIPVTLKADGKTKTLYTTGKTVRSVFEEFDILLGKEDKVIPALDSAIKDQAVITVIRVRKETVVQEHPLIFQIVNKQDPNLLKGRVSVVQNGKNGIIVKKFEKVYKDGNLVAENLLSKTIKTNSVSKIVAIGTKKAQVVVAVNKTTAVAVTRKGVTFKPKKVLKNVTLTAYAAGVASTGKGKNHPQYGITASGAKVKEGRTIAVDPKVIPIGYWVYIEGIGYRRAEDKGSAVKGNKIDVYYDSEKYANKFGKKYGYTVYVIGPNKPSSY